MVAVTCVEEEVTAETTDAPETERIGRFEFLVRRHSDMSQFDRRFENRADALAAWLLARWRLQNAENN